MTDLPAYTDLFNPLLRALRELGGSARPDEAGDLIAERERLSEEQLALEHRDGGSQFKNKVAWARFYLAKAGYIDSSRRGVWSLTSKGQECGDLSPEEVEAIRRQVQSESRVRDATTQGVGDTEEGIETGGVEASLPESPARLDHRDALKTALLGMSPEGFERFCQRLLRESGFESVKVLGRTGDGGIDGEGLLRVNPLVSFRVIFQCKRYKDPVGTAHIRDFRGAMAGKADRGLFITTSSFTRDAEREAVRDGADPIELLDAEGIMDLLEELEVGVQRVTAYEVDGDFFAQFSSTTN